MDSEQNRRMVFNQPLTLIEHPVNGDTVEQRPQDGYINATNLCRNANRLFADYRRLQQTERFLEALALDMGIPISNLVQVIRGRGDKTNQGTWVHPQVAINLGQWLSPEFAVQVSRWVMDWVEGRVSPYMPEHVQRYLNNRAKIPHTHFSMLNEIYLSLLAPLEEHGIVLTEKMMPDISTGKLFSQFLRDKGIDTDSFPSYKHEFVDSTRPEVNARLYPNEYLAEFRKYFNEVWLPERAKGYFEQRLPDAVPLLPDIQQMPSTDGDTT